MSFRLRPSRTNCDALRFALQGTATPCTVISSPSPTAPTVVRFASHCDALLRGATPCTVISPSSPPSHHCGALRFAWRGAATHGFARPRVVSSSPSRPRTDCGALCCAALRRAVLRDASSFRLRPPSHQLRCAVLRSAWQCKARSVRHATNTSSSNPCSTRSRSISRSSSLFSSLDSTSVMSWLT